MLLFAKTTSERATKSQGGNDYVRTDYYGSDDTGRFLCVIVTQKDGKAFIEVNEVSRDSINEEVIKIVYFKEVKNTKGNKRKTASQ